MKNFIEEFKKFISRGNVLDLAIGVVIGGAFQTIINSLVNDIIMPIVALITADVNFSELGVVLKETGENQVILSYGNFIQAVVNFLIVAFTIFCVVKAINKFKDKKEKETVEEPAPEPVKSDELVALEEIRDLLKKSTKASKK